MNPHWEMRLWTDDNLPPILNRNAWAACGNVGGTPGCVMRSDILRLEILARNPFLALKPRSKTRGHGWER